MNSDGRFHGRVTSAEFCSAIPQVSIIHLNGNNDEIAATVSDRGGNWSIPKSPRENESLLFRAKGFVEKRVNPPFPGVVRLLENRLIGYLSKLWALPGDVVTAHIHSPVAYRARLFRHGIRKTCSLHLGEYEPCVQTVPDGFFVAAGLNWRASFSYRLPAEIVPGLYSILLEGEGEESFAIPLVVSTPTSAAGRKNKLLVLVNTTTWQSYNLWGGRSRYRNYEGDNPSDDYGLVSHSWSQRVRERLATMVPDAFYPFLKKIFGRDSELRWKFEKLSIRRPFTNCQLEGRDPMQPFANHLAAGEWRLLAWLEREGIPYDVVTGYELHSDPDLLRDYRAILFSTHCEYWSQPMYEAVKTHHESHGLWILNMAGNTMFREIEFGEDGSTRCVSLSFKDSCADETQILGVRFTMIGYGTCAPYRVHAGHHWACAGLDNDQKKSLGKHCLNRNVPTSNDRYDPGRVGLREGLSGVGASGWELDRLSKTAPQDFTRIARGQNKSGGADMVVREPDGCRGGVFSASSITFGGSLLVDDGCSRLARNVIGRALDKKGRPVVR